MDVALPAALTEADQALLAAARAVVRQHYRYGSHTVGTALRTQDGQVFAAVNLDATVGRLAVCAEPVALGQAVLAGVGRGFEVIVAVRHPRPAHVHDAVPDEAIAVVSPCGGCRDLLFDYAPDADVIVPGIAGPIRVRLRDLLPVPYRR
jgi:cytidine deaminase